MDPSPAIAGSVVALVLWLAVLALRGGGGGSKVSAALAALLPLAAVVATHLFQGESLVVPPKEFLDAALVAGLAAVPLALLAGLRPGAGAQLTVIAGFAGLAGALFYSQTTSLHERYWDGEVIKWVSGLTGAATLALAGRLGAEAMGRTAEAALAVGLAAVAAAPALGWSGTGVTAFNVAAVSASAGLFGLLILAHGRFAKGEEALPWAPQGRAAAVTQTALFAGFLGNGALYCETPLKAAGMLLGAPLLVLLPGRGLVFSLLRLTLVAGVAGAAAYLSKGEPNPYGY